MEIVMFIDTGIRTTFFVNEEGNLEIEQGYDGEFAVELTSWQLEILENYLPVIKKEMLSTKVGEA